MIINVVFSYWVFLLLAVIGWEWLYIKGQRKENTLKRWPANLALLTIMLGLVTVVPISSIAAAHWAESENFGLLNWLDISPITTIVVSFLIYSLSEYLVHLSHHKIPFLWRFHKIHHSDRDLDVTTTFRQHPVSVIVLLTVNVLTILLFGLQPVAVLIQIVLALVVDLSHHTVIHFPSKLDRMLRAFIITPSLHHIHHSDYVVETDSNYGHDLAIWDQIFGTFRIERKRAAEDFRYGLEQFSEQRANDLDALLKAPFKSGPYS